MEAEACASACLMGNSGSDKLGLMLAPYARKVESDLQLWLVDDGVPVSLAEAMHYCVLGGGKRLRPALVYLAAEAAGGSEDDEHVRRSAAAIEMVHTYSLVHDDLPAMDDDSLRRGRPTAHVKFGQAMAILAGDALLTRAFGVLAEGPAGGPVAELTGELASAAGAAGMIAGQVADMALCEVPAGLDGLQYIHMRKTAALIRSAARMGAICQAAPRRPGGPERIRQAAGPGLPARRRPAGRNGSDRKARQDRRQGCPGRQENARVADWTGCCKKTRRGAFSPGSVSPQADGRLGRPAAQAG